MRGQAAVSTTLDGNGHSWLLRRIGLVGAGRVGTVLAGAFRDAGFAVSGPWRRGEAPAAGTSVGSLDAVLLCVPDRDIETAARRVARLAPFVGHTSGATPLSALAPAADAGAATFGLHPLQTFTGEDDGAAGRLAGAGCAVAGSNRAAKEAARALAERLGMVPLDIDDGQRPAYHAAASIAANFLIALEDVAETIAGGAGISPAQARRALAPLVRTTVENWAALGPERALTGPVSRGDDDTVAAQRAAVARQAPALLPVFDALLERTRALAERQRRAAASPTTVEVDA